MQRLISSWQEYELLDSGNEEKLERFGKYILIRPEPEALWNKTLSQQEWNKAQAVYIRSSMGGGRWQYRSQLPSSWNMKWEDMTFQITLTGFKHTGVFPEQAVMWKWIKEIIIQAQRPVKVLNLFAYTGGSTLASLSAGAHVTHVDAAKDIVTWAHENVKLSGMDTKPVRWIVDDALKFVTREVKRGVKYDAIIMDPPKFGRGASGQVWKIEEDLPKLLQVCAQVLSDKPLFFILNSYATGYSSVTLHNLISQMMQKYGGTTESGELLLQPSQGNMGLSTGMFGRWRKQ
jgi:23S rRNA (cytosine1962-C5)-methyltransferase